MGCQHWSVCNQMQQEVPSSPVDPIAPVKRGKMGAKGAKGEKGDACETEELSVEIEKLKESNLRQANENLKLIEIVSFINDTVSAQAEKIASLEMSKDKKIEELHKKIDEKNNETINLKNEINENNQKVDKQNI